MKHPDEFEQSLQSDRDHAARGDALHKQSRKTVQVDSSAALRERIKELERAAAELALTVSADPTRRNHIPPAILAKINALTAILKGKR